ncbi:MAG: hypothetical protein WDA59_01510 [Methanofastidiosum sp.]|jgi:hypothetical protein
MEVKIIRSFSKGQKRYIPGEVYSVSSELAKRYVSRGDAEIIVEKEIKYIKPKVKSKRRKNDKANNRT